MVLATILTKCSESLKFVSRSGFRYIAQLLLQTRTYYEMQNVKRDGTKETSN